MNFTEYSVIPTEFSNLDGRWWTRLGWIEQSSLQFVDYHILIGRIDIWSESISRIRVDITCNRVPNSLWFSFMTVTWYGRSTENSQWVLINWRCVILLFTVSRWWPFQKQWSVNTNIFRQFSLTGQIKTQTHTTKWRDIKVMCVVCRARSSITIDFKESWSREIHDYENWKSKNMSVENDHEQCRKVEKKEWRKRLK